MTLTASPRLRVRSALLVAVVAGTVGLLSGCAPEPGPVGPTDGASPAPTPSGSLPPTDQPDLGEPGPECGDVLSPEDVYAYNPNMSAVAAPTPAADSLAAQASELDGAVCRWSNDTSNIAIDVAVAVPGEDTLADLETAAESDSESAEAFSNPPEVRGFFEEEGGVGTAQVFADGRWIVLSSPMFVEQADVEPLVTAILENLADA
jgi:hypothetical protein